MRWMNIHPMSCSSFTSLNEQVVVAYEKAACDSMRNAAAEVRERKPVTLFDMPCLY